jgi:hypothetical protein
MFCSNNRKLTNIIVLAQAMTVLKAFGEKIHESLGTIIQVEALQSKM